MKLEKIKSIKRIGLEDTSDLVVSKNHNFIANNILVHNSGWGKGLASESIAEELHKLGYIVLVIADPKIELEWGYSMFPADELYHTNELKKQGKIPEGKKVKLYHPFTFSIPNGFLPDMNFFTFSLKDLGRKEWGMLAETSWDTDTVKLLVNTSQNIGKEDGIFGLLHHVQDAVRGKKDKKDIHPDWNNFGLSVKSGTAKSVTEISNYLKPFKRDFFLTKDSCRLKLDWGKILTDPSHYHVFVTNWIEDDKLKEFVVLSLFSQIVKHKNLAKRPLCIIIPEVRKLVPFKPQGYKMFLSEAIKENLSTMRSMGRGMSSILDSQVFSDIDEDVSDSATVTLIGELGGARDVEKLSKARNYKRDIREQLSNMEYQNSFLISAGKDIKEDLGAIRLWFPSHMHCEPHYNFFEMYKKYFSEKMVRYTDLISEMKEMYKAEELKFKEKLKRKEKQYKEEKEKEDRIKQDKILAKSGIIEREEKAQEKEDKSKEQIMKLCYDMKQKDASLSYRAIAKEMGIKSHKTVKNYIDKYAEKVEEESGEDFEDNFVKGEGGGKFRGEGVMVEEIEGGEEDV
ncbi:MAG: hypothetical protein KKF56_05135 [Nanoarchaeota archaeon]|nr:hypothetical protein [Nanoarchaeota archaeon]